MKKKFSQLGRGTQIEIIYCGIVLMVVLTYVIMVVIKNVGGF